MGELADRIGRILSTGTLSGETFLALSDIKRDVAALEDVGKPGWLRAVPSCPSRGSECPRAPALRCGSCALGGRQ